ncbi:thioredoxin family protein [Rhodothermus sp. AH-315-K08]|nr:thioredoxin family protein [Rhodothermus sp. AH-315-K08]
MKIAEMIAEIDVAARARSGADLESFLEDWKAKLELPATGLDRTGRLYRHYAQYNWDRYQSVLGKYRLSDGLRRAAGKIGTPETWLFITEPWCTDAAYSLPVVQAAAASNPNIDLRMLMRDSNSDVMELFLTGTARSIPILATFDHLGEQRFRWGSKPKALAESRLKLKEEGLDDRKLSLAVIEWYEAEGWLEVERELTEGLSGLEQGRP